jgi:ankyrin
VFVLDTLQKRNSCLSITHLLLTDNHNVLFDLVQLNIVHYRYWIVPKAQPLEYWRIILMCFNLRLWLLIFFSLFALSLVWHYSEKQPVTRSLELHYQILLESGNSYVLRIKRMSSRLVVAASILGFGVISTLYKSELIRLFTSFNYEHQIDSLDDIVKYNLPCYDTADLRDMYDSSTEIGQYANRCVIINSEIERERILRKIVSGEKLVTTFRWKFYNGVLAKFRSQGLTNPLSYAVKNKITFYNGYLYLTKGYPLYDNFVQTIRRILSSGFGEFFKNLRHAAFSKHRIKIHANALTSNQFFVQFLILFIGLGISTVAFLLELVVTKIQPTP